MTREELRLAVKLAESILLQNAQYVTPAPDAKHLALAVMALTSEILTKRLMVEIVRIAIADDPRL